MMRSVDKSYNVEIEIQKSKFFAYVFPAFEKEKAENFLHELNEEHKKATHVCYAYCVSEPAYEKCSDDGEPSGTAGKPILEVIKKSGLDNLLIVVVRYFGGIKLGAGGLLRAYSNSAKAVLDSANVVEYRKLKVFNVECGLSQNSILDYLNKKGVVVENIQFSDKLRFDIKTDDENILSELKQKVEMKFVGVELGC